MLIAIFQIDPKLTFDVFHILNRDHISNIEGTEPLKTVLFLGGSGGLKYKDINVF